MAQLSTPASLLARLAQLDSCACCDAMDQAGISGVAVGLRSLTVARRISGSVITVQLAPVGGPVGPGGGPVGPGGGPVGPGGGPVGPGGGPVGPGGGPVDRVGGGPRSARHLGTAAIEAAASGDVIVVAAAGRTDAAGWGGVLSLAASIRQVSGVIVDGACRDVDETAALGLPVYALAAVPATARGRQAEIAWNEPVLICGVSVCPGDLVVADGSGVVFLPAGQAADIITAAESIAAREAAMLSRIRAGEAVSRVMSADYEQMLTTRRRAPGPADRPGQ
jgi:4-hydroxy-4-methyl-2-oxoglutarate aldolase